MDRNIYANVCQFQGHHILNVEKYLLDPKTNATITIVMARCIKCGGTDDELEKAPQGFIVVKPGKAVPSCTISSPTSEEGEK